jgi:hypothetical protein
MKKEVEAVINFKNGKAEVFLPKNATNIHVRFSKNLRREYLCATVDSDEKEKEKYLIVSDTKKKTNAEAEGFKFLKSVFHMTIGNMYWYYKKC